MKKTRTFKEQSPPTISDYDERVEQMSLSPTLGNRTRSFVSSNYNVGESPHAGKHRSEMSSGVNLQQLNSIGCMQLLATASKSKIRLQTQADSDNLTHCDSIQISLQSEKIIKEKFLERSKNAALKAGVEELPSISCSQHSQQNLRELKKEIAVSFRIPKCKSFNVTKKQSFRPGITKGVSFRRVAVEATATLPPPQPIPYDCSDLPTVDISLTASPTITMQEKRQEVLRKGAQILRKIGRVRLLMGVRRKATTSSMKYNKTSKSKTKNTVDDTEDSILQLIQQNSGMGMALPTASDLLDLPAHLRTTFIQLAREAFRKFLYPRALLWLRLKDRKRLGESSLCPPMTLNILQRQELFKNISQDRLVDLIPKLILTVFKKNEFLIHESEQAGSGIFFVMTGSVAVYKKENSTCKKIGETNGTLLARLLPMACVGEFAFLTEEPRMATITALERVECWVLRKQDFNELIKGLHQDKLTSIITAAFANRNATMHLSYPMTESGMKRHSIFQPCSSSIMKTYLKLLQPYAVPKNFQVMNGSAKTDRILFLQNGKCAVMRGVLRKSELKERRMSLTHVHTLRSPCVIGDTAVLHGSTGGDSIVTLSTCDFWILSRSNFLSGLRRHPGVEIHMMAASREQRQEQLSTQQNLFKDCVYDIPFIRDVASTSAMKLLVKHFKAKVYRPLSVICSRTAYADRLIILYKGHIRIASGSKQWCRGESVGYTAIIPHKWAENAVCCDVVECLELDIEIYIKFLRTHNIYNDVIKFTKLLMFPYAFNPKDVELAKCGVADLQTPPFYPISKSLKYDLTEEGFNGVHYKKMISRSRLIVTNKTHKKPCTRIGSCLWKQQQERPETETNQQDQNYDSECLFRNLRNAGRKRAVIQKRHVAINIDDDE